MTTDTLSSCPLTWTENNASLHNMYRHWMLWIRLALIVILPLGVYLKVGYNLGHLHQFTFQLTLVCGAVVLLFHAFSFHYCADPARRLSIYYQLSDTQFCVEATSQYALPNWRARLLRANRWLLVAEAGLIVVLMVTSGGQGMSFIGLVPLGLIVTLLLASVYRYSEPGSTSLLDMTFSDFPFEEYYFINQGKRIYLLSKNLKHSIPVYCSHADQASRLIELLKQNNVNVVESRFVKWVSQC